VTAVLAGVAKATAAAVAVAEEAVRTLLLFFSIHEVKVGEVVPPNSVGKVKPKLKFILTVFQATVEVRSVVTGTVNKPRALEQATAPKVVTVEPAAALAARSGPN